LSNESFLLRDVLTDSTFIINASNAKYTVTIPINAYATRILKFERLTLVNDKIKSNVKVYPNPAANFLHVDLGVLRNDVLVKIFSIEGRCVYENILNNNLKLDLSKLENGMYLISVDGYYTRFIKQ
jgi:hypothetical protein